MNENINNKNRPSKNDYGQNYVSILGYPDFENADGQFIKGKYANSVEVSYSKTSAEKDNEVLRNEKLSKHDLSTPREELDDNEEGLYSVREANTLIGLSGHKLTDLSEDNNKLIQAF